MSKTAARGGFSLVELLVATAVSMIIGGGLVSMMYYMIQLTATQNRNMLNQESLRDTAHFITDEILAMGSGTVEPYISSASAAELTYIGDLDNNGTPDRVRYTYDAEGAQLLRTLYSTDDNGQTWNEVSTDVLLDSVADFSFDYYGVNHSEAAGVDDVTCIELAVELNPAGSTTAFTNGRVGRQMLTTCVTIRNRML